VVKAETTDVAVRSVPWWYWALVSVVMFSLVLTLATRTFHVTLSYNTAVQSGDSQAVRQHMDRDGIRWAAPVAKVTASQAPTFYPRVAQAGPPLPTLLLEKSLYNRPPPTC
jgi:hypothetical protein